MPPLRLNIGLPLLVADLLIAGVMDFSPWRSVALVGGIVLAMWMAYSLNIPPRRRRDVEPEPLEEPELTEGRRLRPLTEDEQRELEHEATRHRPLQRP